MLVSWRRNAKRGVFRLGVRVLREAVWAAKSEISTSTIMSVFHWFNVLRCSGGSIMREKRIMNEEHTYSRTGMGCNKLRLS